MICYVCAYLKQVGMSGDEPVEASTMGNGTPVCTAHVAALNPAILRPDFLTIAEAERLAGDQAVRQAFR